MITESIKQFMSDQNTVEEDEWYVLVLDTTEGVGYFTEDYFSVTEIRGTMTEEVHDAMVYLSADDALEAGKSLYNRFRAVNGWCVYRCTSENKISVSTNL
jgi:hypothetical protein